ncbi:UDP-glucose 4-epimerase GalE [uncultured Umboniibacter sp.]|uniref:UDP-glucose 4-epimerase GalE n=1 Tax=uncultured Umboniibacter sp. TaxID=1798917 RepID=UPI0026110E61|nr:UDP-glucose 4-epimerase GalE [uncultured Umboniibacter sp.]
MSVLVTGGAGYIGSHTAVELLDSGFDVVVVDNLCNSNRESLRRVEALTGKKLTFIEGDICDANWLDQVFASHNIDSVIHFAALKAVGESVSRPIDYYHNNVSGTLALLAAMNKAGVSKLVFSSSATVYGSSAKVPYREDQATGGTTNPYGSSKLIIENMLLDCAKANPALSVAMLRYFNPIGAHESGLIGEDPQGIPNNLMPFIAQVAVGKRSQLSVFGGDYNTPDGTCLRDYLHVVDLAVGHVQALDWVANNQGAKPFNLGTGNGTSVLEMIAAFEAASGVKIPYEIVPRREGDLEGFWADSRLAEQELGWKAKLSLERMMIDTWRWQHGNPNGYLPS